MYNNETKIKLNIGAGNYLVTSTINAIIFKKIDRKLDVGQQVSAVEYSKDFNIIDICTIPFHNYSEI
jgi:molybdopterin-binding protein